MYLLCIFTEDCVFLLCFLVFGGGGRESKGVKTYNQHTLLKLQPKQLKPCLKTKKNHNLYYDFHTFVLFLSAGECVVMGTELRIVIFGTRWSGKSSSGNTILGAPKFECGRVRTLQCEVRCGTVSERCLTIVDVPGWSHFPITETSEASKQQFKLSLTKCLPGPHACLLVIPLDMAFTKKQGQYVQEHLSLLGDRVWKHVVVLFTCWDYLENKTTIDDHIKSEGEALQKVLEKCKYRFQVFDNKRNTNPGQVDELLTKIEELVKMNAGEIYKADEKILQSIAEKRKLAAERASLRKIENDKQRERQRQLLRGIQLNSILFE